MYHRKTFFLITSAKTMSLSLRECAPPPKPCFHGNRWAPNLAQRSILSRSFPTGNHDAHNLRTRVVLRRLFCNKRDVSLAIRETRVSLAIREMTGNRKTRRDRIKKKKRENLRICNLCKFNEITTENTNSTMKYRRNITSSLSLVRNPKLFFSLVMWTLNKLIELQQRTFF